MDDPLYSLPMTQAAPDFRPTQPQRTYAALLCDPACPRTETGVAEYVGEPADVIRAWQESPRFRQWLAYETERHAGPMCMALWRDLFRMAQDDPDPGNRLEAMKLFLGRFDPGVRAAGRDVRRAVGDFAKTLAKEAVKSAGPRHVQATVVHGA